MSAQQPPVSSTPTGSDVPSEQASVSSKERPDTKDIKDVKDATPPTAPALATQETQRMEAALGDAILRFLRIRKGPKGDQYDLDAIATQPSIWDSENVDEYKELYIHPQWENMSAFDPSFRWTWREERAARRKVDWKIMAWVCIMFAALNINRNNISNAVSDNLLDDLNMTRGDYNIGQTIARVGFLVAELPSQLISKRIGPDLWIPIQICIFSFISAMQFFMQGRNSYLACRYLIATFQGGFIPDTILYLSYWYTGRSVTWFWMFSQIVDIGIGFAAVGLVAMRGVLGYAGWRWLFLIEGLFTFLIGIASFFLMPQSPAKTKSKWSPNGWFNEKEVKIIVNSVIRDDPQKGGMHNRQGLSIRQIWECAKDYDMWPLYALGLLFGLPKYPVDQYLTLAFRGLGFNVIETNLLAIPNIVGSSITMLAITAFSELVNNRSFVAMAEDAWLLPCFVALIAMPEPISGWAYFAIATVLLSFPYTHPIQVAWTSRNAGSVQNRTVSASLYNMWVQVSGMIGANIYQPSDAPRYFKANKGLLVICIWMCLIQYPGTYFYYNWRNRQKAKKWDAMTPEEQHHYRATTTDGGNKSLLHYRGIQQRNTLVETRAALQDLNLRQGRRLARGHQGSDDHQDSIQSDVYRRPQTQTQNLAWISDPSDFQLYHYRPLSSPSSFRILSLQLHVSGIAEESYKNLELHGSLIEASFANSHRYFALSYCWGDSSPTDKISIDGRVLPITASCGSALRRMLRARKEPLIWVDSICINQGNTPEALAERSQQVSMMDQIYRGAEQVNVHLGEGDDASDVACEALKSLTAPYLGAKLPGPQQEACRKKYESLADDILQTTEAYPYGKLHGFFRLPWFRRCWVVQEVALGRKVMFYCGKYVLHMKNIVVAADFTRLPYSKVNSKEMGFHWKSYLSYHDAMNEFIRRKEEGEPISNFGMTLSTIVLLPALTLEATRPEDKIFSLYGLCKRFGFAMPAPDYQKPLAVVYTEAAATIIESEGSLELLSVVTESPGWYEHDLPSWVPDFSGSMRHWSPSNPPRSVTGSISKSRVSGSSSYDYILEPGATRLVVKGRRLGIVLEAGLPWMMDSSTSLLGDASRPTGQYIGALMDSIGGWYDIAKHVFPHENDTMAIQAMIRTLLLLREHGASPAPASLSYDTVCQCLSVLIAVSKSGQLHEGSTAPLVLMTPDDHFTNVSVIGRYHISATMQIAIQHMMHVGWKKLLRVAGGPSRTGEHLAVGTYTARPNDLIVVFSGSPTAAILRPYEDGFRYVGPAAVDGIMDGEFWSQGSDVDDEFFVLI
ncbi:major facilitator superfamily transporter [Paramyrothecium foliicola]|nr:major facilitator superfamily transporter [Paramyrothecium foliicola]